MADDEAEEDAPAVQLGEGETVEGAPVARVASRLTWPQKQSDIINQEGDTLVRTPGGPRPLSEIIDSVDNTYFDRRQTFVNAVLDVIGRGPVQTED